jgi:hypothetical protein
MAVTGYPRNGPPVQPYIPPGLPYPLRLPEDMEESPVQGRNESSAVDEPNVSRSNLPSSVPQALPTAPESFPQSEGLIVVGILVLPVVVAAVVRIIFGGMRGRQP